MSALAPVHEDPIDRESANEISSFARAREIASVLARHGLWHVIYAFGLKRFVPFHLVPRSSADGEATPVAPDQLRMALEELGPTFMKLGQVLATRSDLVAPSYQAALSSLQDAAPPVPADAIREIVEEELGQSLEQAFATFDCAPLATGSIGQAHLATLHDGTEVVVKVRRPDAVAIIEADLQLLHHLAAFAGRHVGAARQYDLASLVDQFDKSLHAELDYQVEGHNNERIAQNFADDPTVHVPRVCWQTSTSRVLTLERIRGMKVTDDEALAAAGVDRQGIAHVAADIVFKMVFEDGFFHADLHTGNLFIESPNRIGLIDFGMVGVVDDTLKEGLGMLMVGMLRPDTEEVIDSLTRLGVTGSNLDRRALRTDLEPLLQKYGAGAGSEAGLSPLLGDVMAVIRKHHLVLPGNLSLLFKTMASGEGTILRLDPSFRLVPAMTPYARRLLLRSNSPRAWAKRVEKSAPDVAWLATDGPRLLRRLLGDLESGPLKVDVQPSGFEAMLHCLERIGNRLVLGMVVSALIVALGVSASAYRPGSSIAALDMLVTGGFVVVAFLGGALAWSIFRSAH